MSQAVSKTGALLEALRVASERDIEEGHAEFIRQTSQLLPDPEWRSALDTAGLTLQLGLSKLTSEALQDLHSVIAALATEGPANKGSLFEDPIAGTEDFAQEHADDLMRERRELESQAASLDAEEARLRAIVAAARADCAAAPQLSDAEAVLATDDVAQKSSQLQHILAQAQKLRPAAAAHTCAAADTENQGPGGTGRPAMNMVQIDPDVANHRFRVRMRPEGEVPV